MDEQKSYGLMWVGAIAELALMLVGGSLAIEWLLVLGGIVFIAGAFQTLLFSAAHTAASFGIPAAASHTIAPTAESPSGERSGYGMGCPACGAEVSGGRLYAGGGTRGLSMEKDRLIWQSRERVARKSG